MMHPITLMRGHPPSAISTSQYQEKSVHLFTVIQQEHPDIILEDMNIGEEYGIGSSFRRGA